MAADNRDRRQYGWVLEKSVLVTGTVGAGKTTTGFAMARRLSERGLPAGFIDLDTLSRLWPAPAGDPFRVDLTLANLASIVGNFEAAGAVRLVLSGVVESLAELHKVEEAVGRHVSVVRLVAPLQLTRERLHGRHVGAERDGLDWHLARAPELDAILDSSDLDVVTVNNISSVAEAADAALGAISW